MENISHLLAVTIDRQWLADRSGDAKPCHPSLILNAHLMRAIDA
jgi:hypothetical protein